MIYSTLSFSLHFDSIWQIVALVALSGAIHGFCQGFFRALGRDARAGVQDD